MPKKGGRVDNKNLYKALKNLNNSVLSNISITIPNEEMSKFSDSIKAINDILNEDLRRTVVEFSNNLASSMKVNSASLKTQTANLSKAYENENLVLVLGAGVSVPYNIPDWNTLLQRLLIESNNDVSETNSAETGYITSHFYTSLFKSNPLTVARYIQGVYLSSDSKHKFERAVRQILYENIDRESESEIMEEIVQLCISPGKLPNLDSIITYNYDDVLEEKIQSKTLEVPIKSIYYTGMNPQNGELPIYHVHGYLPESGTISDKHAITLSESIYHKQYLDIYSWNNIVQINKFSSKICLFIGNSFSDPNMRRLMDIGKQQRGTDSGKHYIIKRRIKPEVFEARLNEVLQENSELMNLKEKQGLELKELVLNLVLMNQNLEEKDAHSFGAEIIWIDDYEKDIPLLLRTIRHGKSLSNFS